MDSISLGSDSLLKKSWRAAANDLGHYGFLAEPSDSTRSALLGEMT